MISVGSVVQIYSGPPASARGKASELRLGEPSDTAEAVAPKPERATADLRSDKKEQLIGKCLVPGDS